MKIYFKSESDPELSEWGISIPLLKSRAMQICNDLDQHSGLKGKASPLKSFLLNQQDLIKGGHDEKFVSDLFSNEDKLIDPLLLKTYELVNLDGSYHRFNPAQKKRRFQELFMCQLREASNSYQSALKAILDKGQVFYLSGGMHHAMTFGGRGFCLINDAIVAIRKLQREKKLKTAWVVDVDVHKGDGTAQMSHNDDSIITLSIHMKNGWPLDMKPGPWSISSNIDVEIENNDNENYLIHLREGLGRLLDQYESPEFLFINAGGDPYEKDALKSSELIQLSRDQMLQRNQMLYRFASDLGVPSLWTMGGGYGDFSYETYADFFKSIAPQVREADTFEVV